VAGGKPSPWAETVSEASRVVWEVNVPTAEPKSQTHSRDGGKPFK